MRMIDEDEVGLTEKPEDTRYIKKITVAYIIGTVHSGKCRCVMPEVFKVFEPKLVERIMVPRVGDGTH